MANKGVWSVRLIKNATGTKALVGWHGCLASSQTPSQFDSPSVNVGLIKQSLIS